MLVMMAHTAELASIRRQGVGADPPFLAEAKTAGLSDHVMLMLFVTSFWVTGIVASLKEGGQIKDLL